MKVDLFLQGEDHPNQSSPQSTARAETVIYHRPSDQQYKIILLDADDSFDIVVHFPNGERECVFSLAKES